MIPFTHVVHADWSAHPRGRWAAQAHWQDGAWRAEVPQPVPDLAAFVDDLFALARQGPTLAGFDMPVGLPVAYGVRCGFAGFRQAVAGFAPDFFTVATTPAEIGPARPFYPARPGGALRQHLVDGHAVASFEALTRRCERGGAGLKPAGSLFWTLGAAQVGKAALVGWQHVIRPALARGAQVWPFDGDLPGLAARGGLTLAETYPADGYARLGAGFGRRESKRRQADRAGKAAALEAWAAAAGVALAPALRTAIRDGFGAQDRGGDSFDAAVGLLAVIDVLRAPSSAQAPREDAVRRWEGWILGRPADA